MRNVLRNKRKINKITQNELAEIIGISQQLISLIESGRRKPTIETAKRLEMLFNTPMEELFPDIFDNIN